MFYRLASLYNIVNKTKLVHIFFYYVYFFSLHVSADYVHNIRRNNCIYATLGSFYSVWITVWYAGAYAPAYQTVIHTDYVHNIRRNNCIYATLGSFYSVWMTVWYAGAYAPAYQTVTHTE